MSIAYYFPFRRIKIVHQSVAQDTRTTRIDISPDKRFLAVCSRCGHPSRRIHSHVQRRVRDLNLGSFRVWVECHYRKVVCMHCRRVVVEDLELFSPCQRVTKRLALYIHELCKMLTVKDVADHLGLDWKTVRRIDKHFLELQYGKTDTCGVRILAVDEIAIRKGHCYLTVVLDYERGRVIWVGKHRRAKTLSGFFNKMPNRDRKRLKAIVMDMWDPYIKAVQKKVPHVKIVFDLFHVVAQFSRVIDKVRRAEYRKASEENKSVFKGARYLLLRNRSNLRRIKDREHLRELLELNEVISTVMILRDKLKHIWSYKFRTWARKAIDEWCALARCTNHPAVQKFADTLDRYSYGILNHCDYPIHTGKLEGVNNKIKVIKRKAYGYHDLRYFSLKIIQAFTN
ncbi:MAG: ISL3 family transposase [Acidobacteria bacterium]|nr:ISL3 family transposase [Acidobacteriota bacterium]